MEGALQLQGHICEQFIEVGTAVERLARIGEVVAATTMSLTQ
ncbi:hypothetical protein ACFX1X_017230 [Malus domestica]